MTKTYDPKCLELAEAFVADLRVNAETSKDLSHRLAIEIQDTIENFIEYDAAIIGNT
jgi:hypothetical protein